MYAVVLKIEEYTISKSSIKLEMNRINYTINNNAVILFSFLDSENKAISSGIVYIDGDDFKIN